MPPFHGLCVHLLSLHSKNSCGNGEIFDLKPLLEFTSRAGMNTLQLLPLNDTGSNPSPYSARSSCALHPIYLSCKNLPYLRQVPKSSTHIKALQNLNKTSMIAFEKTYLEKMEFLKTYVSYTKPQFLQDPAFQKFTVSNRWLNAYETLCWNQTGQDREFTQIIQYLLYTQLKEIKTLADSLGIFLMGDTPILTSKDSAEVLEFPQCFNLKLTAGAPPDGFNAEGQNWDFPLFVWDQIAQTNWQLWQDRLHYAQNFYDLFRLDHVIGLFWLYGIPDNCPPNQGIYTPSNLSQALEQGFKIAQKILSLTHMTPIGEDLGIIPEQMRDTLVQAGIPGTKVIRWTRNYATDASFIPLDQYPTQSLTTLSTHDTQTLSQWWEQEPQEAHTFCQNQGWEMGPLDHAMRRRILKASHQTSSLYHINLLGEYLALFDELVYPDINHERINQPGTLLDTNWCRKTRTNLETITSHGKLAQSIKAILTPQTTPAIAR